MKFFRIFPKCVFIYLLHIKFNFFSKMQLVLFYNLVIHIRIYPNIVLHSFVILFLCLSIIVLKGVNNMQISRAVKLRLKRLLKENDMSEYNLSILAGISPSIINDFIRGKVSFPRLDNLLHICEGLNITLKEFFDDPVFEDVKAETKK